MPSLAASLEAILGDADLMQLLCVSGLPPGGILEARHLVKGDGTRLYTDDQIERAAQILAGSGLAVRTGQNALMTTKGEFFCNKGWVIQPGEAQ